MKTKLCQSRHTRGNVKTVTPDLAATNDIVSTQVRLMQSSAVAARVAECYAAGHPQAELVPTVPHRPRGDDASMVIVSRADNQQEPWRIEADVRANDRG